MQQEWISRLFASADENTRPRRSPSRLRMPTTKPPITVPRHSSALSYYPNERYPTMREEVSNMPAFIRPDTTTCLGKGSNGSVYACVNAYTGDPVPIAMKTFSGGKAKLNYDQEVAVAKVLLQMDLRNYHRNVIQFSYYDCDVSAGSYQIFMEYDQRYTDISSLVETRALVGKKSIHLSIMEQLFSAITWLHQHRIAHRDIKPGNILVDTNNFSIKLIDFGFACHLPDGEYVELVSASPIYAAPELFDAPMRPYNPFIADTWSAGVTIVEIATNELPFYPENGTNVFRLIELLRKPESTANYPATLTPFMTNLLRRIFIKDPTKRICALQALGEVRREINTSQLA